MMWIVDRYPATTCWVAFVAGAVFFWASHP